MLQRTTDGPRGTGTDLRGNDQIDLSTSSLFAADRSGPQPHKSKESNDRNGAEPGPKKPKPSVAAWVVAGLAVLGGYSLMRSVSKPDPEAIIKTIGSDAGSPEKGLSNVITTPEEALELAKQGKLRLVVREFRSPNGEGFTYEFVIKGEHTRDGDDKPVYLRGIVADEKRMELLHGLRDAGLVVLAEEGYPLLKDDRSFFDKYSSMIWLGVLVGSIVWLARRSRGGGLGEFSKHKGEALTDLPEERFSDIGGSAHVVEELVEFRDDISRVVHGDREISLPRGVLMTGPPGVGKTMFARALAGECGVPFFYFDSSRFVEMLVGVGASRVNSAFENARQIRDLVTEKIKSKIPNGQGVVIMFFDEFESLGGRRDRQIQSGGGDEHKNTVNALLQQMDGVAQELNLNIVVIAATNFRDELDPALLRPGRFTKQFDIPPPRTTEERLDVLRKLSQKIVEDKGYRFAAGQGLEYIAKITPGFTGDDLRGLLVESKSIARQDGGRREISDADLFEAYQRRVAGGRIQRGPQPQAEREQVAHHEHGHAIEGIASGKTPMLLSMKPRGNSLGRVIVDPERLYEGLARYVDYLADILISAGGRAAELERYGELGTSAGAFSDLEHTRETIRKLISAGMIGGYYSTNLMRLPPHQLQPEHRELIDKIDRRAIEVARKIIRAVGQDQMDHLVRQSLELDRELVGKEAGEFYAARLSPEKIAEIQKIAMEFFEDPTGDLAGKVLTLKQGAEQRKAA